MSTLEFDALSVVLRGRTLLERVTLTLPAGDFVTVLGPNGAGKTTLLKSALGLHRPTAGTVRLSGRPLSAFSAEERAGLVCWLPQHTQTSEPLSALDGVAAARFRFSESYTASRRAALDALQRVRATALAERALTRLSGGERQRVALAALLAQEAPILLVDEPANHLDPAQQVEVYRLLGELWREGRSVLCVSHDPNLLRYAGDTGKQRVAGLRAGQLVFDSRLDDARLPEALSQLFEIEMVGLSDGAGRVIVPKFRSFA